MPFPRTTIINLAQNLEKITIVCFPQGKLHFSTQTTETWVLHLLLNFNGDAGKKVDQISNFYLLLDGLEDSELKTVISKSLTRKPSYSSFFSA